MGGPSRFAHPANLPSKAIYFQRSIVVLTDAYADSHAKTLQH